MIPLLLFCLLLAFMLFIIVAFFVERYDKPSSVTEVLSSDHKIVGSNIRIHLSLRDRLRVLVGKRLNLMVRFKLSQEAFITSSKGEVNLVKRNCSFTTVDSKTRSHGTF